MYEIQMKLSIGGWRPAIYRKFFTFEEAKRAFDSLPSRDGYRISKVSS